MKKAQILSAIALAFALGVVAPVAGVNTASAVEVTTPTDKATATELKAAIAKAENNATYKAYKVLSDVSGYADIDESTLLDTLNDAIEGLNAEYTGDAQKETLSDALTVAVATTSKTNYTNYSKLYTAVKNVASQDFNNIKSLAEAAGLNVTLAEGEAANVANLITKIEANATYGKYATLIEATVAAQDAQIKQGKDADTLADALKAWGYQTADVINAAKATKLEADGSNGPIAALKALATPALNGKGTQKTNFADLADKITAAETAATADPQNETANATALNNLEKSFYTATGVVLSAAPAPAEGDDNQGANNGETNNGNNGSEAQDPSAPGTGIVSSAEGNAATTVSIVAGLATALTALGAGVVAYRSARRSNK